MYLPISFFLNFYMSILLDLGISLAQLCLPAYTKLQSINLDLGIKLLGSSLIPKSKIDLGLVEVSAFKVTCILNQKEKFVIFERVSLPQPGYEPRISGTEVDHLTT